ncbi:HEAT repeat domain-containing protein [Methanobrevibacter filiformis]|uniref:HEAT repeat protein n=1 Tax=Methanobrevibacter filiformis TaxID=55758 RepID=A0A166AUP1_9EURY|nr:HEAT repeat domain-containing protein [Methanobrevibacter filiformis]KZX12493.1 hypothetical protein MBFIL_11400 [Methanobrevibacter filiformis]
MLNRQKRGQIENEDLFPFKNYSRDDLLAILNSKNPQMRTIAVYSLAKYKDETTIYILVDKFKTEKALYTRLAISQTLVGFGEIAIPYLIELLGRIGNNHEKTLPSKYFNKKSFPLPRDLAARTIANYGEIAIPYLIEILNKNVDDKNDLFIKQQTIDAIGAIVYKSNNSNNFIYLKGVHSLLENILDLFDDILENNTFDVNKKYSETHVLIWKILRSLSGFKKNEFALDLIFYILCSCDFDYNDEYFYPFYWEAIRSIGQIGINSNETTEFLDSFEDFDNIHVNKALEIAKWSLNIK